MENDKLWAPWRVRYIRQIDKKDKECIFCKMLKEKKDDKNFIFLRKDTCFSVLNIYPYNNGHCLVVPNKHVNDISKLKKDERNDLLDLLDETKGILDKALSPHGYNLGMNIGRVSGAGFPGHLHIHIVPRWKGDVNFMPVVANTKVISQSLKELYKQLQNENKKRYRKHGI